MPPQNFGLSPLKQCGLATALLAYNIMFYLLFYTL